MRSRSELSPAPPGALLSCPCRMHNDDLVRVVRVSTDHRAGSAPRRFPQLTIGDTSASHRAPSESASPTSTRSTPLCMTHWCSSRTAQSHAQARPGDKLDGLVQRPDLHVQSPLRSDVPQRRQGDGAGRQVQPRPDQVHRHRDLHRAFRIRLVEGHLADQDHHHARSPYRTFLDALSRVYILNSALVQAHAGTNQGETWLATHEAGSGPTSSPSSCRTSLSRSPTSRSTGAAGQESMSRTSRGTTTRTAPVRWRRCRAAP